MYNTIELMKDFVFSMVPSKICGGAYLGKCAFPFLDFSTVSSSCDIHSTISSISSSLSPVVSGCTSACLGCDAANTDTNCNICTVSASIFASSAGMGTGLGPGLEVEGSDIIVESVMNHFFDKFKIFSSRPLQTFTGHVIRFVEVRQWFVVHRAPILTLRINNPSNSA